MGRFGNVRKNFPLSKSAFKPFMLYEEEGIDDMVRGLTTQSSQKFDRFFTREVGLRYLPQAMAPRRYPTREVT